MKGQVELYLKRAEKSEENAARAFEDAEYDSAIVHLEVAMQLLLRAKKLDFKGYLDKPRSVSRLLADLEEIGVSEEIGEFLKKYGAVLGNLESASKAPAGRFTREEAAEALKALAELRRILSY